MNQTSESSNTVRALVGGAVALFVAGYYAPLLQWRSVRGDVMVVASLNYSQAFLDRAFVFVLFVIVAASLTATLTNRYEYLSRLGYTSFLATIAMLLLHAVQSLLRGHFSFSLFVPLWLSWWPHQAFGYAWLLLLGSAGLLCAAGYVAGEAPELEAMLGRVGSAVGAVAAAVPRRPPPSPHGRWEKSQPRARWEDEPGSAALAGFWRFVAAGLIFSFCTAFFPLGYFLWKYLDDEGSPHAGLALTGTILGTIAVGGGFLLKMILVMVRVAG